MSRHVIIDGNNLLHAMHKHAPVPNVGRETLVRIIERWARQDDDKVTLVFDGSTPRGGLADQMRSSRITVRFSERQTADDIIVALVRRTSRPDAVQVITSDTAIRHEARLRKCRHTDAVAFVRELYAPKDRSGGPVPRASEKPGTVSPEEAQEWMDLFGVEDEEDPAGGFGTTTR